MRRRSDAYPFALQLLALWEGLQQQPGFICQILGPVIVAAPLCLFGFYL